MKSNQSPAQSGHINPAPNRKRAENKDNLDSRKNEEQDDKGDDVTHNEKERRSKPKGQKDK